MFFFLFRVCVCDLEMDSKMSDPFSSDSEELPSAGIMGKCVKFHTHNSEFRLYNFLMFEGYSLLSFSSVSTLLLTSDCVWP